MTWHQNLAGDPYGMSPDRVIAEIPPLHSHDGYALHSHEVRSDHEGVPRVIEPMKVHGPLDFPAMAHNKQAELAAVLVLQSPLSTAGMRQDAEAVLVGFRWPELAVRVVKGERI